jgi:hypothetical protein
MRFIRPTIHLGRDFPLGFLFTTGMGVFRDSLPARQVCKPFFQSAAGFSPAMGRFVGFCAFSQALPPRAQALDSPVFVASTWIHAKSATRRRIAFGSP